VTPAVRDDPAVQRLLAWAETILEKDFDPIGARRPVTAG